LPFQENEDEDFLSEEYKAILKRADTVKSMFE